VLRSPAVPFDLLVRPSPWPPPCNTSTVLVLCSTVRMSLPSENVPHCFSLCVLPCHKVLFIKGLFSVPSLCAVLQYKVSPALMTLDPTVAVDLWMGLTPLRRGAPGCLPPRRFIPAVTTVVESAPGVQSTAGLCNGIPLDPGPLAPSPFCNPWVFSAAPGLLCNPGSSLKPTLNCGMLGREHGLRRRHRYLEFCVYQRHADSAVHNLLLSLYAEQVQ